VEIDRARKSLLQSLPSVEETLQSAPFQEIDAFVPRAELVSALRASLEEARNKILVSPLSQLGPLPRSKKDWIPHLHQEVKRKVSPSLIPLINATGVIIHTNLGRSLLAQEALEALQRIASHYSNLEFHLEEGKRGSRYVHVEDLLCRLTGAEAATVVNNNAGAVLLALNTLARGGEVIVSRGELVEIGGSFRMPDVMAQSGARLVEVGTTNKTHPRDYEEAIGPDTALLLKVHTSNFRILGFTQSVPLGQLVELGRRHGIPVMEDLGSGCLVDLRMWGLEAEPTVQESLRAGADVVTFSGDKLLGGPQAGLILGRRRFIEGIRQNPLNRALRIDKLTLAALEATLRLYWDPFRVIRRIPTLRMLTTGPEELRRRALRAARGLRKKAPTSLIIRVLEDRSKVGGGALPLLELPTWVLSLRLEEMEVSRLDRELRSSSPPVIGRIHKDELRLDLRTVSQRETPLLIQTVASACRRLLDSSSQADPPSSEAEGGRP